MYVYLYVLKCLEKYHTYSIKTNINVIVKVKGSNCLDFLLIIVELIN